MWRSFLCSSNRIRLRSSVLEHSLSKREVRRSTRCGGSVGLAQWQSIVVRLIRIAKVEGSSPSSRTKHP